MPKGQWVATLKNLKEYNAALSAAQNAVRTAYETLTTDTVLPEDFVREHLPYIAEPEHGSSTRQMLQRSFATRADFEMELRYLNRVVRASKAKPTKKSIATVYDNSSQLTSFYLDAEGFPMESVWERAEESIVRQRENRRALETLKEAYGVEMTRTPLIRVDPDTGERKEVRDESRHVVYTYVPATPRNANRYMEAIQADPSLQVEAPREANQPTVYVDFLGDLERANRITHARRAIETPQRRYERTYNVDRETDRRNQLYFENYRDIIDTALPDTIADEMDSYFDALQQASPAVRESVYRRMAVDRSAGYEMGDLEFLYLDRAGTLSAKVARVVNYWRETVAPKLKPYISPEFDEGLTLESVSEEWVSEQLQRSGYILGSGQTVMGEYRAEKEIERVRGRVRGEKEYVLAGYKKKKATGVTLEQLKDRMGW